MVEYLFHLDRLAPVVPRADDLQIFLTNMRDDLGVRPLKLLVLGVGCGGVYVLYVVETAVVVRDLGLVWVVSPLAVHNELILVLSNPSVEPHAERIVGLPVQFLIVLPL